MVRARMWFALICVAALMPAGAQMPSAEVPAPNAARLKWWREARFGMFIHWGPVSLKGTEIGWSRGAGVPIEEYDALHRQFNPAKFDADRWARIARSAGMKYIIFTTKHHDGFCMFDTKQTDFNIMNSPFKRDVVKELAAACRKHGLAFGTYHSVCDWHHPDFPLGSPGGTVRKPQPNLDRYEQYLRAQVAELIQNYGPLLVMWFDVPQEFTAERGQGVVDFARSLQPDILVNNRCAVPGDYDTPEQTIGGYQDTRPWETCMTIANQWAWKPDDPMKSLAECLQTLIRCAGGDGNLLFNIGPMPTGEIEPDQAKRLEEMGRWLRRYGRSVYATRGGPYRPGSWGCSTRRGKTVYLHIMDWLDDTIVLPPLPRRVVRASVLTGGSASVRQTAEGITIAVPRVHRSAVDTIVALELDGPAEVLLAVSVNGAPTVGKSARASNVYQQMHQYGAPSALDDSRSTRWATDAGTRSAWLEVDLGAPMTIGRMRLVQEPVYADRIRRFELQYREGDEWRTALSGDETPAEYVRDFAPVTARVFRLNILEATEGPTIGEFELWPPPKT